MLSDPRDLFAGNGVHGDLRSYFVCHYFDTGILSARRISSITRSLHPPMTKTRCVPVLTPASANSTVTRHAHRSPAMSGKGRNLRDNCVTDPTIRNGSNSQHVFSPNDNRKRSVLGRAYVWREQPGDITRLSFLVAITATHAPPRGLHRAQLWMSGPRRQRGGGSALE